MQLGRQTHEVVQDGTHAIMQRSTKPARILPSLDLPASGVTYKEFFVRATIHSRIGALIVIAHALPDDSISIDHVGDRQVE
jgi:hypothetical protein